MVADVDQKHMKRSEVMVKLLCHTSRLKSDDRKLLRSSYNTKCCTLCNLAAYENTWHVVMQCPVHENTRREMYKTIRGVGQALGRVCDFPVMMGKYIDGWDFESMMPIWKITSTYIPYFRAYKTHPYIRRSPWYLGYITRLSMKGEPKNL